MTITTDPIQIKILLHKEGERIGRDGMLERINDHMYDFIKHGMVIEGALTMCGSLMALAQAAEGDEYLKGFVSRGYNTEVGEIQKHESEK